FSLHRSRHHWDLPSFPTRRSSDLPRPTRSFDFGEQCPDGNLYRGSNWRETVSRMSSRATSPWNASISKSRMRLKAQKGAVRAVRSEEHTSELQSRENLVCRLLLEK